MSFATTVGLFIVTAIAELVGCYLWWMWLKQGKSTWLAVAGIVVLALFAWLLTLHDAASGRVYAAYGGIYVALAFVWLMMVDGVRPTSWDIGGVAIVLAGMAVIVMQPRAHQ